MLSAMAYRIGLALLSTAVGFACVGCFAQPGGSECAPGPEEQAVLYDDAVATVSALVPTVLPDMAVEQSDLEAMSNLAGMLKQDGIRAGVVRIQDDVNSVGNLDACVAIETLDHGVACLYVMPSDLDVQVSEERIQAVYLEKGSKVGLIAATFARSMKYSWYISYLDDLYEHYDGWNWLVAFDEALAEYSTQLDRAIDYVEYPPELTRDLSSREWDEYEDLIRLVECGIDEYNALIETYNAEWEILEAESPLYPEQLFYIETTWEDLLYPVVTIPDLPAVPVVPAIPVPSIITPDDYLCRLDQLASVAPPALPDRDACRYDRITDNNFVVADFDVEW